MIAGIVLSTLLVPQGMAYAELAGLPAITGQYMSILTILGSGGSPERAIALASMLALIVGVVMIAAGAFKLGS